MQWLAVYSSRQAGLNAKLMYGRNALEHAALTLQCPFKLRQL